MFILLPPLLPLPPLFLLILIRYIHCNTGLLKKIYYKIPECNVYNLNTNRVGGELEADLKLLSIATEIVSSPPVIILEDPFEDLDSLAALKVMEGE